MAKLSILGGADRQINDLTIRRAALMARWADQSPNPAAVDQVAEKIGVAGSTLWRWEQRKVRPHRLFLNKWIVVISELEAS
jgi:transcriptional regulator with XRE-family HTH domain